MNNIGWDVQYEQEWMLEQEAKERTMIETDDQYRYEIGKAIQYAIKGGR